MISLGYRPSYVFAFVVLCSAAGSMGQTTAGAAERETALVKTVAIHLALDAGNRAFNKKDYEGAIAIVDAAISANPTHSGVPALLTTKAQAQINRGREFFNSGIANKDAKALDTGRSYLRAAADTTANAVTLARELDYKDRPLYLVLHARKDSMFLFASRVDPNATVDAIFAFNDYFAVETNRARMLLAQLELGELLLNSDNASMARPEFESVLEPMPKNTVALFGLGETLLQIGKTETRDRSLIQKAANSFKAFLTHAPANDPKRNDALRYLATIKEKHGIVPK